MKRLKDSLYIALASSLYGGLAYGAGPGLDETPGAGGSSGGVTTLKNPISANNLNEFLAKLIDIALYLAVPVLVLAFIWVGFQFVIAQGNATKIAKAKSNLWYTLLGAAIVIGIKVIQTIVTGTIDTIAG